MPFRDGRRSRWTMSTTGTRIKPDTTRPRGCTCRRTSTTRWPSPCVTRLQLCTTVGRWTGVTSVLPIRTGGRPSTTGVIPGSTTERSFGERVPPACGKNGKSRSDNRLFGLSRATPKKRKKAIDLQEVELPKSKKNGLRKEADETWPVLDDEKYKNEKKSRFFLFIEVS